MSCFRLEKEPSNQGIAIAELTRRPCPESGLEDEWFTTKPEGDFQGRAVHLPAISQG